VFALLSLPPPPRLCGGFLPAEHIYLDHHHFKHQQQLCHDDEFINIYVDNNHNIHVFVLNDLYFYELDNNFYLFFLHVHVYEHVILDHYHIEHEQQLHHDDEFIDVYVHDDHNNHVFQLHHVVQHQHHLFHLVFKQYDHVVQHHVDAAVRILVLRAALAAVAVCSRRIPRHVRGEFCQV